MVAEASRLTRRTQLRLTPEMLAAAEGEAVERDVSVPSVLRDAICDYFGLPRVPAHPTPEQRASGGEYWSKRKYLGKKVRAKSKDA